MESNLVSLDAFRDQLRNGLLNVEQSVKIIMSDTVNMSNEALDQRVAEINALIQSFIEHEQDGIEELYNTVLEMENYNDDVASKRGHGYIPCCTCEVEMKRTGHKLHLLRMGDATFIRAIKRTII